MDAAISPTCSLTSVSIDCSPDRMRWRASRTHEGHSESVERGQPSGGADRSWLFGSGAGAHRGWNVCDASRRLTAWNAGQARRAEPVSSVSTGRQTLMDTEDL